MAYHEPKSKELIMANIQGVLKKLNLKYRYNKEEPQHIDLDFSIENKPFTMNIGLQNMKIVFRITFPFRAESSAIPLVSMYMAEFNADKAFSILHLDPDNGKITMEYSYILDDPACFDQRDFCIYLTSLIHDALGIYTKISHLSVGMVSGERRRLYKTLLTKALAVLDGEHDEDDVSYGIEHLTMDESDDCDEDGDDIAEKLRKAQICSRIELPPHFKIPTFEEFLRAKREQYESKDEGEEPNLDV